MAQLVTVNITHLLNMLQPAQGQSELLLCLAGSKGGSRSGSKAGSRSVSRNGSRAGSRRNLLVSQLSEAGSISQTDTLADR